MPPFPFLVSSVTACGCGPRLPAQTRVIASATAREFPPFLPKEVERIKDHRTTRFAKRIERIPVKIDSGKRAIMSSCVRPLLQSNNEPVVLLHAFDSSCMEWRFVYPLLEDAGVETWAIDILGWGFSDLEILSKCDVPTKRKHLYKLWRSYIKKPMVLVGPSLGAAVAIDFLANHPEAVSKLVLIDASVYAEGVGNMAKLPKMFAYAGVSVLKSLLLRLYATKLALKKVPKGSFLDWTNVGRLHCLLPWWEDATVEFMLNGGYNVVNLIKQVKQKTLVIWGEEDQIINKEIAINLRNDLQDSILYIIPDCGHLPHIEKPDEVAELILSFLARENVTQERLLVVLS